MKQYFKSTITLTILLLFLSCKSDYEEIEVNYQDEHGNQINVVYHNPLDENNNYFVTLKVPGEKTISLNQSIAASGVRYTDDKTLVWWTKGDGAIMMKPDKNEDWKIIGTFKEISMRQIR
ncbi:MliC family protein [Leptospira sp. WS39.C2]